MNALETTHATAPATHPAGSARLARTFRLLLRREYWEHKGGFLWAPLIAGGISLLLSIMAAIVGLVLLNRAVADGDFQINGIDIGMLTREMSPSDAAQLAQGLDWSLMMSAAWPLIVLAFVVFFYCLGALYDDRKDRSVLFWKSLPLSDTQTVLSKLASAVVVAPVIAVLAAMATMFASLVLMSLLVLAFGGNPVTLLWGPASPLRIVLAMLAWIPVYAVWALPTVGWLLLCSAWARSKPFLWATAVPVITGLLVSWFDIMQLFELGSGWFWRNVVGRLLLGTVPGVDVIYRSTEIAAGGDAERAEHLLSLGWMYSTFLQPGTWIGALAGVAMIALAIRLRRWRDEG